MDENIYPLEYGAQVPSGVGIRQHVFENRTIRGVEFAGCHFYNSVFRNVEFEWCGFSNCLFDNPVFDGATFKGCNMPVCRFKNATVKDTYFNACNLFCGEWRFVDQHILPGERHDPFVKFHLCNMVANNFEDQDCGGIHFIDCNLAKSYFDRALMRDTVLTNVCLVDASFVETDINQI